LASDWLRFSDTRFQADINGNFGAAIRPAAPSGKVNKKSSRQRIHADG
jgi:hypothetical protein